MMGPWKTRVEKETISASIATSKASTPEHVHDLSARVVGHIETVIVPPSTMTDWQAKQFAAGFSISGNRGSRKYGVAVGESLLCGVWTGHQSCLLELSGVSRPYS